MDLLGISELLAKSKSLAKQLKFGSKNTHFCSQKGLSPSKSNFEICIFLSLTAFSSPLSLPPTFYFDSKWNSCLNSLKFPFLLLLLHLLVLVLLLHHRLLLCKSTLESEKKMEIEDRNKKK